MKYALLSYGEKVSSPALPDHYSIVCSIVDGTTVYVGNHQYADALLSHGGFYIGKHILLSYEKEVSISRDLAPDYEVLVKSPFMLVISDDEYYDIGESVLIQPYVLKNK